MNEKTVSPKMSLKGWKFNKWLEGNGKTVKELLKVGIPLALSWFATKSPVWTPVFTIVGKLVLDTVEYYLKEYTE